MFRYHFCCVHSELLPHCCFLNFLVYVSLKQCHFLLGFHCAASALELPLSQRKGKGEGCEDSISDQSGVKEVGEDRAVTKRWG